MVRKKSGGRDLGLEKGCVTLARRQALLRHQRGTRHLPATEHHARHFQVRHAARKHGFDICLDVRDHVLDYLLHRIGGGGQAVCDCMQICVIGFAQLSRCGTYLIDDAFRHGTAITHCLATNQIIRLNGSGSLVNCQDACITVVLCGAPHSTTVMHAS